MKRALKRRTLLLSLCLAAASLFAAWTWLRPYEWNADPGARYRIVHTSLEEDHSYFWLGIRLEQAGVPSHDLLKPVRLLTADGREIEPADTQMEGDAAKPVDGLAFRFWLEEKDLGGPLKLRLNDGTLTVRSGSAVPDGTGTIRYFLTSGW
jgi:hypothetical protein